MNRVKDVILEVCLPGHIEPGLELVPAQANFKVALSAHITFSRRTCREHAPAAADAEVKALE